MSASVERNVTLQNFSNVLENSEEKWSFPSNSRSRYTIDSHTNDYYYWVPSYPLVVFYNLVCGRFYFSTPKEAHRKDLSFFFFYVDCVCVIMRTWYFGEKYSLFCSLSLVDDSITNFFFNKNVKCYSLKYTYCINPVLCVVIQGVHCPLAELINISVFLRINGHFTHLREAILPYTLFNRGWLDLSMHPAWAK